MRTTDIGSTTTIFGQLQCVEQLSPVFGICLRYKKTGTIVTSICARVRGSNSARSLLISSEIELSTPWQQYSLEKGGGVWGGGAFPSDDDRD